MLNAAQKFFKNMEACVLKTQLGLQRTHTVLLCLCVLK